MVLGLGIVEQEQVGTLFFLFASSGSAEPEYSGLDVMVLRIVLELVVMIRMAAIRLWGLPDLRVPIGHPVCMCSYQSTLFSAEGS